jgi:formylglycine-generating enzyme required for sulfatase activity
MLRRVPRVLCRLTVVATVVTLTSCEDRSTRYDAVDSPQPRPVPVDEARASGERKMSQAMTEEQAAKCGRGTGRTEEGSCVQLGLRDVGYVQRVRIPEGSFVMGFVPKRYDGEPGRESPSVRWSGQPPRIVESAGFWIDLHEVTRSAYSACVEAGDCTAAACPGGEHPAADESPQIAGYLPQTCVTYAQAEAFCAAHDGRLPTEIEWEYAARGSDARIYPWGNEIRDEISGGLLPAGRLRADTSYFGILGMGSNAIEWVEDRYVAEAALQPFLRGEFRRKTGPVARARKAFEARVHCGDPPARGCRAPARAGERRVVKSSVAGGRRGVRVDLPPHATSEGLEGWDERPSQPKLGFRCAADLVPGRDEPLSIPEEPPEVPLWRQTKDLEVFGGVAEAVSRLEAERFCEALRVSDKDELRADWRLPTLAEVERIADSYRGPGPFWTADGAAAKRREDGPPRPSDPWAPATAEPDEALLARCVRTPGS